MKGYFFAALAVAALVLTGCNQAAPGQATSDQPASVQAKTDLAPGLGTQANLDTFESAKNPDRDYLILVNAVQDENGVPLHKYEFGGEYDKALQDDLIYLADVVTGEPTPLEKATALAFTQLQQDMFLKGMPIGLYSGYRTEADQQCVYDTFANKKDWGEENTVQEPGFSEHHTGLVVNLVIWYSYEGQPTTWFTEDAARTSSDFDELHKTLADYGFIMRYPKGKEDFTGVKYEPYEIRFVGSSKVAHEIMDNGLCLEEYLALGREA